MAYCFNLSKAFDEQDTSIQKVILAAVPNFKELPLEDQYKVLAGLINDTTRVTNSKGFVPNAADMEAGIQTNLRIASLGELGEKIPTKSTSFTTTQVAKHPGGRLAIGLRASIQAGLEAAKKTLDSALTLVKVASPYFGFTIKMDTENVGVLSSPALQSLDREAITAKLYVDYMEKYGDSSKDFSSVLEGIKGFLSRVDANTSKAVLAKLPQGNPLTDLFTSKDRSPLLSYFADAEGNIDLNLVAYITLLVDEEVASSIRQADISKPHTIASVFGAPVDTKQEVQFMSQEGHPEIYSEYAGVFVLASTLSDSLGNNLFNSVFGQSAKKVLTYTQTERFKAELGALAVSLIDPSVVEVVSIPNSEYSRVKNNILLANGKTAQAVNDKGEVKLLKYKSKPVEGKKYQRPDTTGIDYTRQASKLSELLYSRASASKLPTTKPVKVKSKLSKGSTVDASIEKAAEILANTAHYIAPSVFKLTTIESRGLLEQLTGADKPFDENEYHEEDVRKGSAESRYNTKQRSIEALNEHVSMFGNQSVYIPRDIWQMGRMGESVETVSPQNDKLIHRLFFVPVSNTIDLSAESLNQTIEGSDITLEVSYLESLGESLKLVKETTALPAVLTKMKEYIYTVQRLAVTEGIDLNSFTDNLVNMQESDLLNLTKAVWEHKSGKEYVQGTDILPEALSIIEIANYLRAKQDPTYLYKSALTAGTDAKTSGYALMSAQAVQDVQDIIDNVALKQSGIFINTTQREFNKSDKDAYQELILGMTEGLDRLLQKDPLRDEVSFQIGKLITEYFKSSSPADVQATMDLFKALGLEFTKVVNDAITVTSEGRDFGKPIFMVTNYSAGIESIGNKILSTVNDALIARAKQESENVEALKADGVILEGVTATSWRQTPLMKSWRDANNISFYVNGVSKTFKGVDLQPIVFAADYAVTKQQSATAHFRNTLQEAVSKSFDYLQAFQDRYNAALFKTMSAVEVAEFKDKLYKALPGYSGALATSDNASLKYYTEMKSTDSSASLNVSVALQDSVATGISTAKVVGLDGPKFIPLGTLQMDARIMAETIIRLNDLGIEAVNVHDSIYVAPQHRAVAGKVINEVAFEVMFKYDMAGDLAKSIKSALNTIPALYEETLKAKDIDTSAIDHPSTITIETSLIDESGLRGKYMRHPIKTVIRSALNNLDILSGNSINARSELLKDPKNSVYMLHYVSQVAGVQMHGEAPVDTSTDLLGSNMDAKDLVVEQLKLVDALELTAANLQSTYDSYTDTDNVAIDQVTEDTHSKVMSLLLAPELQSQLGKVDSVKVHAANVASMKVNAGIADVKAKTIYMAGSPSPETHSQSKREVFLHELVHVVYEAMVNNNQEAQLALNHLFEQAKKQLDYTMFLDKDVNGNTIYKTNDAVAETQKAKDMFNYVFNNTSGGSKHVSLKEFLAYGLTNPYMIKALSKIDISRKATSKFKLLEGVGENTVLGKLINFIYAALDSLMSKIKKQPVESNIQARMFELARGVQAVNQKHKLEQMADKVYTGVNKANETVSRPIKAIGRYFDGMSKQMSQSKVNARNAMSAEEKEAADVNMIALAKVAVENLRRLEGDSLEKIREHVEAIKTLEDAKEALGKTQVFDSEGLVKTILNTAMGAKDEGIRKIHKVFSQSKTLIDRSRKAIQGAVKDSISKGFLSAVSQAELVTANNLVTTATGYLLGNYNLSEVKSFWKDPKALAAEIKALEKVLSKFNNAAVAEYIKQLKGLAEYNITGSKASSNQLTDIQAILRGAFTTPSNRASFGFKGSINITDDLEAAAKSLVSLYSIELVDQTNKDSIVALWDREDAVNSNNGITNILYTTKGWYDSLYDNPGVRRKNNAMVRHGYSATITDPNIEVNVFKKSEEKDLKKLGYTLVEDFVLDPAVSAVLGIKEPLAVYKRRNNSATARQSGAISLQNNFIKEGISIVDLYQRAHNEYPDAVTRETLRKMVHEIRRVHPRLKGALVSQSNSSYDEVYIPVVSNFSRVKVLKQNTSVDDVLAQMYADTVAIQNSLQQNKDVMAVLEADYNNHGKNKPEDFVWINGQEFDDYGFLNRYAKEYSLLPKWMKDQAEAKYGKKGIPIRKNHVRMVIGGHKYSIANSSMAAVMQAHLPGMPVKTVLANAELLWQEIVATEKINVVIKTPATWTANLVSNVLLLSARGVPPHIFFRDAFEAIRRLREYEAAEKRVNALKAKGTLTMSEKADLLRLEDQMKSNSIHAMVARGLYQTIAEDVDTSKFGILDGIGHKVEGKLQSMIGTKPTDVITSVTSQLFITQNSTAFKVMNKINTYGDFIGRYSLIKHELALNAKRPTNEKLSNDEIYQDAVDSFINYDLPDHIALQYMNDIGFLMFTKFFLGIQHVIAKVAKDKPVTTASMLLAQHVATDLPDIIDESILFKDLTGFIHPDTFKHIETAITPAGWSIVDDLLSVVNVFK